MPRRDGGFYQHVLEILAKAGVKFWRVVLILAAAKVFSLWFS